MPLGSTSAVNGMLLGFLVLLLLLRRLARSCRNYLMSRAHSCLERPCRVHPYRWSASPEQAKLEQSSSIQSLEPRRRARLAQLDFKSSQLLAELEARQPSIGLSQVSRLPRHRQNSPSRSSRSSSAAHSLSSSSGRKSSSEAQPQTDRGAQKNLCKRPSTVSAICRVAIKAAGSMTSFCDGFESSADGSLETGESDKAAPVRSSPDLSIEPRADSPSSETGLIASSDDIFLQTSCCGCFEKPALQKSIPELQTNHKACLLQVLALESREEGEAWSRFFVKKKLEVPREHLVHRDGRETPVVEITGERTSPDVSNDPHLEQWQEESDGDQEEAVPIRFKIHSQARFQFNLNSFSPKPVLSNSNSQGSGEKKDSDSQKSEDAQECESSPKELEPCSRQNSSESEVISKTGRDSKGTDEGLPPKKSNEPINESSEAEISGLISGPGSSARSRPGSSIQASSLVQTTEFLIETAVEKPQEESKVQEQKANTYSTFSELAKLFFDIEGAINIVFLDLTQRASANGNWERLFSSVPNEGARTISVIGCVRADSKLQAEGHPGGSLVCRPTRVSRAEVFFELEQTFSTASIVVCETTERLTTPGCSISSCSFSKPRMVTEGKIKRRMESRSQSARWESWHSTVPSSLFSYTIVYPLQVSDTLSPKKIDWSRTPPQEDGAERTSLREHSLTPLVALTFKPLWVPRKSLSRRSRFYLHQQGQAQFSPQIVRLPSDKFEAEVYVGYDGKTNSPARTFWRPQCVVASVDL